MSSSPSKDVARIAAAPVLGEDASAYRSIPHFALLANLLGFLEKQLTVIGHFSASIPTIDLELCVRFVIHLKVCKT